MIVVAGASGQIGGRLVELLAERGDDVVGLVRRPEQLEQVASRGGQGVLADLERVDAEELARALRGADAVVFAAGAGPGSGPGRKASVDLGGSVLLAQAALLAGVRRFVQISAAGIDRPAPPGADPAWAAYVEAKREADDRLRATALAWTILRPGPLTDGAGDVGAAGVVLTTVPDGGPVPREAVAHLVVACLDEPASAGRQWWVAGGDVPGATPAAEAVRAAVGDLSP